MDRRTDRTDHTAETSDTSSAPGLPTDVASLLWGLPKSVIASRRLLETLIRAPKLIRKREFRQRLIQSNIGWLHQPQGIPGVGVLFPTLSSVASPTEPASQPDSLERRPLTEAIPFALEAIAWAKVSHLYCELYPDNGQDWESMTGTLTGIAQDAASLAIPDHAMLFLYLAGELPLTLSVLSTNREERSEQWSEARRNLNQFSETIFDGEGIPASELFDAHRLIAASLLRSRQLVASVSEIPGWRRKARAFWSEESETNFEWLVRHLLRWSRLDGGQIFLGESAGDRRAFWKSLLAESGDEDDRDLAYYGLPIFRTEPKPSNLAFPPAASHSDWSGVATLRPNWFAESPRLNVLYESELRSDSQETESTPALPLPPEIAVATDLRNERRPMESARSLHKMRWKGYTQGAKEVEGDREVENDAQTEIRGNQEPVSQILRTKFGLAPESPRNESELPEGERGFGENGVLPESDVLRRLSITRMDLESQVVLLSGNQSFELTRLGERTSRRPRSGWKESLYVSNEDGDLLELTCEFEGGVRVERTYFVGREDPIVLLADAVLSDESSPDVMWEYRSILPMPPEVDWVTPPPTTSVPVVPGLETSSGTGSGGYLLASRRGSVPRRRAIVFPLSSLPPPGSLANRRASASSSFRDSSFGDSSSTNAILASGANPTKALSNLGQQGESCTFHRIATGMELTRRVRGRAFWVPIWLHPGPTQITDDFCGRRLTVGEDQRQVEEEDGVGYRLQLGNRHWLLYRSLRRRGSRSVLGHHLKSEFLLARFSANRGVEPLAEVE